MNKLTKGSIAAGAAGILLLGGLGSLAFWTDEVVVGGDTVTAGHLSLDDVDCAAPWVYEGGTDPVDLFVPGDTITKDCTFIINASGDNLEAELTIPDTVTVTGTPAGNSLEADVSATYVSTGTAITGTSPVTITSDNDTEEITATIEVEFPFGTDEDGAPLVNANDMQDVEATLNDISITLIQQS